MNGNPKTISKEAAKFLGLPFKWKWTVVMKYVRDSSGYTLLTWRKAQWEDEEDRDELFDVLCRQNKGLPHVVEDLDEKNQP